MRLYRCQCGKKSVWCSGTTPGACARCSDCGSNLAPSLSVHYPPADHQWVSHLTIRYTDASERVFSVEICQVCGERQNERPCQVFLDGKEL